MGLGSFLKGRKKSKSLPTAASIESAFGKLQLRRTQDEELKCVFRKFDANGDGKISISELGSIICSLGHPASEEELHKMMHEADLDGDGFIDLNEFIEINTRGVDSTGIVEDLKQAFLVFDIDGSGSISAEELHKVLHSLGDKSSVAECKKMIRGVDCNGDGLIDFEEFKIMMMQSLPPPLPAEFDR